MAKILLVEDSISSAALYEKHLSNEGWAVVHVSTGSDALDALESLQPQLVLLDLDLPDLHGLEILEIAREKHSATDVVVITADARATTASAAMRKGARDFLVKPIEKDRLIVTVGNLLERRSLENALASYEESRPRSKYAGLVGSSPEMQALYTLIGNAAASAAPVFIFGESGTGKEVCASALHDEGPRAGHDFVAVNCAAIPESLFESEIFGHVRGAFSGAIRNRDGAAVTADGGTLFLDEICELPMPLQGKLLRFLESREVRPVGSDRIKTVDVRVVSASNKDPAREVAEGRFREDLYYRLDVIRINMPPIRGRADDILELCAHFIRQSNLEEGKQFDRISDDAAEILANYRWPGNVRELQNMLRRITALHDGGTMTADMLPDQIRKAVPGERSGISRGRRNSGRSIDRPEGPGPGSPGAAGLPETGTTAPKTLAEIEREAILSAMARNDDNVPRTAAELGINPSTLYRKLKGWNT